MADTTIDYYPVQPGMLVWDYDLREAVVGEVDHTAQDGTRWYSTTSLDGKRRSSFDSKRMWFRHPSTGQTVKRPERIADESKIEYILRKKA